MQWSAWCAVVVVLGCGGGSPSNPATDASVDTTDGGADALPDSLPHGMLTAEPADLASTLTCNSRLGFPGTPVHAFFDVGATQSLLLADITGDDELDLLVHGGTFHLVPGTGNGAFGTSTALATPTAPTEPRLRDVNGDNRPDLLYGDRQGASVYVRLNDGSGGFAAAQTVTSSLTSSALLEVEDFNNDGVRDLITYNDQSRAISVMLATNSAFGAGSTYSVDNGPSFGAAIGDLTGDGRADIVTLTSTGISLWLGTGTGLTAGNSYAMLAAPIQVVLRDVNADGLQDVIASLAHTEPVISVQLNEGGGVLAAPVYYATGTREAARKLAFADVDGDENIDVVASAFSAGPNDIALLRGDGAGAFETPQVLTPDGARAHALGDIDRDGDQDLVTYSAGGVVSYTNRGSAPFYDQRQIIDSALTGMWALRMVDLDNDGDLDIVETGVSPFAVTTRRASNDGFASTSTVYPIDANPKRMIRSDLDNDNDLDIVVAGSGIAPLLNDGAGGLVVKPVMNTGNVVDQIIDGELTGDGWRDLVIAKLVGTQAHVQLCAGHGDGTFANCADILTVPDVFISALARGDLDKDGHLDLLVSYYAEVAVLRGNGNGTFAAPVIVPYPFYHPHGLLVRDLDGDSNPDVLDWDGTPDVRRGNGTLAFPAPLAADTPDGRTDGLVADMNGDGHLDVVTAGFHTVNVALGHGDGTFDAPLRYEAHGLSRTVSVADVNTDGRLDIVVDHGAWVSVLHGRCVP